MEIESDHSSDLDLGFDNDKQMMGKSVSFGDMPRPSKTINKLCREDFIHPLTPQETKQRKVRVSFLKKVHYSGFGSHHGTKTNNRKTVR